MEKLKLTASQKVIFRKALLAAHDAGKQDATFLMSGVHQLVDGPEKIMKRVISEYCEDDDVLEEVKEKEDSAPISTSRYREPGDGHDQFS